MIPILAPLEANLRAAAKALAAGELVAFPTETVYGLGASAGDALALARVFEVKRRPFFDPLIVHVSSPADLSDICGTVPDLAARLMEKFWPGPLTLVLPKSDRIPDLATSGLPTVAVRMPAHPVALELIRLAGPLAAPSANPFGRLSPTSAPHVQDAFAGGIAMILDGGPCSVGVESTILSLEGETPVLLRRGGLSREDIEAVIGPIALGASVADLPQAPGQLAGHYAPRTPLRLLKSAGGRGKFTGPGRFGLLAFRGVDISGSGAPAVIEVLSPTGDLREAAARLFSCLHRLDRAGLDGIEAESVPENGLGAAIMDRLRKAEAGSGPNPEGV